MFGQACSHITLKDLKGNFYSTANCNLINPTKCKVRLIIKHIINIINVKNRKATDIQQLNKCYAITSLLNNISINIIYQRCYCVHLIY